MTKLKSIATAPEDINDVVRANPDKLTYSLLAEVLSPPLSVAKHCELLTETVENDRSQAWLREKVAAIACMSGTRNLQAEEVKLDDATIKWSPAPKAKTIDLILRTKADQLQMVRLLKGLCASGPLAMERLAEVFDDVRTAAALLDLLADSERLKRVFTSESPNK